MLRVDAELRGDHDAVLLNELGIEHDNIRAVLAWAVGADPSLGLETAIGMGRFWWMRGHSFEERQWLDAHVAVGDRLPPALLANGLAEIAFVAGEQGDLAEALSSGEKALALAREISDDEIACKALQSLGHALLDSGRRSEAEAAFDEVLALARRAGNTFREAATIYNLAVAAQSQGDLARARVLMEKALVLAREIGTQEGVVSSVVGLASLARQEHMLDESLAFLRDALVELRQLGFPIRSALALLEMSAVLSITGKCGTSARLLGAAEAAYEAGGVEIDPVAYEIVSRLAVELDDAEFERLRAEGCAMTLEEAIEYALASTD